MSLKEGISEEKKSNQFLIPSTLQRVLPRTVIGTVNIQNKDSADWAWQGFIAYGSQSHVVIVDPITLQSIQVLNKHTAYVSKVKWRKTSHYHQISSPYTLVLASADTSGVIYVWNVSKGETVATLQDGNKPILDIDWLTNQDGCEHLLAALHPPYSLIIWDTKHSTKIWKKSYTETLSSFQFDPFHGNKMAFLCQGCILLVDDFTVTKTPSSNGNRFYVSVPNSSPTQSNSNTDDNKGSLRKRVKGLVSGEIKTRNDDSVLTSECQQLLYHRTVRDQLLLFYPKEVLILDLIINQTVGIISFDRSLSTLLQVIPCWQRDVIYCFHESGTVSVHVKKDLNLISKMKDNDSPSKDEDTMLDLIYVKKCHSEPLRLSKSHRPISVALDPISEKQLCLILGDGRLVFKELMAQSQSMEENYKMQISSALNLSDDHFGAVYHPFPLMSLSQMIRPTYHKDSCNVASKTDEATTTSKSCSMNTRLMMTGLMTTLSTPLVIRMCPPLTTRNLHTYMPLLAIGTSSGTVQVLNLATGVLEREFSLHTYPVRGIEWTSLSTFLSFANQPLTNSHGRVRNELIHTDTRTGYSITLRSNQTEESPIEFIKISYLKQYFIVVLKEDPFELWDCQTLTPLRTMPRKFPKVSALEWSPATHFKPRKNSTEEKKSDELTSSNSKDDLLSLSRKTSISETTCGGKSIIKENLVFTDIQGQLYRFSVEGNVIKDGNKNPPDSQMSLITGIARKSNDIVLSDSDGVLAILDLKTRTSKHINTHRSYVRKIRFAPGKDNMKLLVLYDDGVDIWDIRELSLVATLKSPKSIIKVLDIDWGASDRPVLATIDGSLQVMDLQLKVNSSQINSYFTKEPVVSPYLMNNEAALNLRTLMIHQNWKQKYSLDFDVIDGFSDPQLKVINKWISRIPVEVREYLENCNDLSKRALVVAHLFGDEGELHFWTVFADCLRKKSVKNKKEENLCSCCLQMDTSFNYLCDNKIFKIHELERLLLHESKDVSGSLREDLGRRLGVIGERDRVVRLLLDGDSVSNSQFYIDCLRACLLSATHHSTQAQSTIKLVATNLIAAGNIWEGIELLCVIGKAADACRYLQSYGHWENSMWIAKCVLSHHESKDLVKRYAQYLINSNKKNLGVSTLLSIGAMSTAMEQLVQQNYYQRAALLFEALAEVPSSSSDKDSEELICQEVGQIMKTNIYKKYILFLYGLGNVEAVHHFCNKIGEPGAKLLEELTAKE